MPILLKKEKKASNCLEAIEVLTACIFMKIKFHTTSRHCERKKNHTDTNSLEISKTEGLEHVLLTKGDLNTEREDHISILIPYKEFPRNNKAA